MTLFKGKHPLVIIKNTLFMVFALKALLVSQLYLKADYISDPFFFDILLPLSVVWLCALICLSIYVDVKKLDPDIRLSQRLFFYIFNVGLLVLTITGFLHLKFEMVSFTTWSDIALIFALICCLLCIFSIIHDAKKVQETHPVYQRHRADKVIVPVALTLSMSLFAFLAYDENWQDYERLSSQLVFSLIVFAVLVFGSKSLILKMEKQSK